MVMTVINEIGLSKDILINRMHKFKVNRAKRQAIEFLTKQWNKTTVNDSLSIIKRRMPLFGCAVTKAWRRLTVCNFTTRYWTKTVTSPSSQLGRNYAITLNTTTHSWKRQASTTQQLSYYQRWPSCLICWSYLQTKQQYSFQTQFTHCMWNRQLFTLKWNNVHAINRWPMTDW